MPGDFDWPRRLRTTTSRRQAKGRPSLLAGGSHRRSAGMWQDQRLEDHTEHPDRPPRRQDRRPHQTKTITPGYTKKLTDPNQNPTSPLQRVEPDIKEQF